MTELKALQYPRHVHKGSEWKIVHDATQCDEALDAGWVLSPGDEARTAPVAVDEHADSAAETPPAVDDVPEPDAPKRRKAHHKSRS